MNTHQTTITRKMLIPGDDKSIIGVPSTIPTILKKDKDGYTHVVTDGKLEVGDEIISWPQPKIIVEKIIETRKAKGDWSGDTWKGVKPTWSKILTK